jgi:arylsulfatase A-like enzyme
MLFEDGFIGAFWQGLRFDFSAFAYLNIIFILLILIPTRKRESKGYQRLLKYLFIGFNGFALFTNLTDVVNVQFTGKRMTADILSFILQGDDATNVAGDFIKDYWSLFVAFGILIFTMYKAYSWVEKNQFFLNRSKVNWKCYPISIIVLGLTVIAMRGGTQLRPIKNIHASYYGQGKYVPLILNAPFSIISTLGEKGIQEKKYFKTEEALAIFNAEQHFKNDSSIEKNVLVIILESFGREYIGAYNDFEGYTPFLDSLMSHSLVCENAYANGKKSIEGIPAVISGIPALTDKPYILSQYGSQKGNSIASILSNIGYHTSFYHGGHPGTMGFDAYAEIAGFDNYKDLASYPNYEKDYDGKWGIFDEPYLQYYKTELDQISEPFFSTIFSLSSHHPYTIPKEYNGKFSQGEIPIHESVSYSDYALKQFFEAARTSDWYANTLFIITADHTFKATHKEYQNSKGLYAVPLLIFAPSDSISSRVTKVCQQVDILPTIMDYLQLDTTIVSFGNSIWDEKGFAVNYLNNVYQYFEDGYLLQFNGEESLALYHLGNDTLLKNNLILKLPEICLDLETKLKAYIQEYNYRMINNQLELDV